MNKEQLLFIADHLEGLLSGTVEPIDCNKGICHELWEKVRDGYISEDARILLFQWMTEWSEFSGDVRYPIRGKEETPFWDYVHSENKWTGEYGRARKRLCFFLAGEARNMVRDYMRDDLYIVAKHLEKLGNGQIEPAEYTKGVCSELRRLVISGEIFGSLENKLIGWMRESPEYSGDYWHPVTHPEIECGKTAYIQTADKWKGEYGQARRRLCLYLADRCEKEFFHG